MNIREVKIEEYWPLIVKETEEFGQIAVAENPEFNILAGHVYDVLKDSFIKEATEYGVSRWEKMLGLGVEDGATLDERKVAILTHLTVKLPYTWRVLKQMLTALLGEEKFEISLDNDTQTLTIGLASTVESMREKIDELCARVVPQNLVIKYKEGLPIDYTPVEYLQSTGSQYIDTQALNVFEYELEYTATNTNNAILAGYVPKGRVRAFGIIERNKVAIATANSDYYREATVSAAVKNTVVYNANLGKYVMINGAKYETSAYGGKALIPSPMTADVSAYLFACNTGEKGAQGIVYSARLYSAKLKNSELTVLFDGIPALDQNTGEVGMYDIVNRVFKTNMGAGNFTYPNMEQRATTYSLRNRMYGKITEHGIRRLYRVPEGYNSKEEYAEEHGFKIIVEPPMPEEGYWIPVWHDREDCIELEWVETEPPVEEEVIENE